MTYEQYVEASKKTTQRILKLSSDQASATWQYIVTECIRKTAYNCWECTCGQAGIHSKPNSAGYRSIGYPQVAAQCLTTNSKGKKVFKPATVITNNVTGETSRNFRVLVHHLSMAANKGEFPTENEDVSHLCHNKLCCNPDHLVIESHKLNWMRMFCPGVITIECPHFECSEEHKIVLCQHNPLCIFPNNMTNPAWDKQWIKDDDDDDDDEEDE